jgi:hypothetical protein
MLCLLSDMYEMIVLPVMIPDGPDDYIAHLDRQHRLAQMMRVSKVRNFDLIGVDYS